MSTAKVLQTPKIIEIIGSTIRIAHPNINGNTATYLAAPIAASGTAMTVYDNNGFADNDWFIVGSVGNGETEECDVNGAVTRGQSLTVTNTLKFGHALDAPVTKIFERAIKIYGAATDGGAGTLIASVDAIASPIADGVQIQWDKPYTEYTLISTDTTYAYYYVVFTDGTTDSTASTYVPATGVAYNKMEPLMKQAVDITNAEVDGKRLTRDMLINWANDCQDNISQFVYRDSESGRLRQKDWSYEVTVDETITLTEGEDKYALSGLGSTIKYPNSDKSIISVAIGSERPMKKMAIKDFDIARRGVYKTYMNGTGAVGATSITVDSTVNFASSGSLRIGSQSITYTGTTSTTFTGIPASGTGSITSLIADDTAVWQGVDYGQPGRWVIFEGHIYFERPPSSTFDGYTLKVRFLKQLSRITSVADGTSVPFSNVFTTYFASMIFFRLGQAKLGGEWRDKFNQEVRANAEADYIPQADEWSYYNFSDGPYDEAIDSNWSNSYYDY